MVTSNKFGRRVLAVAAIPIMGVGIGFAAANAASAPPSHGRSVIPTGGPICRVLHGNEKPDHKMCTPRAPQTLPRHR